MLISQLKDHDALINDAIAKIGLTSFESRVRAQLERDPFKAPDTWSDDDRRRGRANHNALIARKVARGIVESATD